MNSTTVTSAPYCGVSIGTVDWSQFVPELRSANADRRDRDVVHPSGRCGDDRPCADCIDYIWDEDKLRVDYHRREWAIAHRRQVRDLGLRTPTVRELVGHAERFGPDVVVETARDYLNGAELAVLDAELSLTGKRNGQPAGTRQRRTTGSLRDQVVALRDRGVVAAAIADTLNLSDRRVRELLNESGHLENGARKRNVQAKLFAA